MPIDVISLYIRVLGSFRIICWYVRVDFPWFYFKLSYTCSNLLASDNLHSG